MIFNPFKFIKQGENADESLPKTRKQLFFHVLSKQRLAIFLFSLTYAAALLPSELLVFVHLLMVKSFLTVADYTLPSHWLGRLFFLFIPIYTLSGPLLAGFARVSRNLARGESASVSDFASALKTSWKQTLLLSFLTSALPLLVFSAIVYQNIVPSGFAFSVLNIAVLIIALFWILMLPTLYLMAVTYDMPFSHLLWNGIFITFHHFGAAVKRLLLSLIPLLVLCFFCVAYPYSFALLCALYFVLYILFFYGLDSLLSSSYANKVCESELNIHIAGSHINIGLESEQIVL